MHRVALRFLLLKKSEIRSTKLETNPKHEAQNTKHSSCILPALLAAPDMAGKPKIHPKDRGRVFLQSRRRHRRFGHLNF
jgi:hypothetical protein